MKIKITGKSMVELYKEYGVDSSGFYSSDPWWKNEAFANEKPEPGEYEITFDKKSVNKIYADQIKELKRGFTPSHPAVITDAILNHFKETGKRLCEDWYVRSGVLDSDGGRVHVGFFGAEGLVVNRWFGDDRGGSVGLSSARKLRDLKPGELESVESLSLEKRVESLENQMESLRKFLVF